MSSILIVYFEWYIYIVAELSQYLDCFVWMNYFYCSIFPVFWLFMLNDIYWLQSFPSIIYFDCSISLNDIFWLQYYTGISGNVSSFNWKLEDNRSTNSPIFIHICKKKYLYTLWPKYRLNYIKYWSGFPPTLGSKSWGTWLIKDKPEIWEQSSHCLFA